MSKEEQQENYDAAMQAEWDNLSEREQAEIFSKRTFRCKNCGHSSFSHVGFRKPKGLLGVIQKKVFIDLPCIETLSSGGICGCCQYE